MALETRILMVVCMVPDRPWSESMNDLSAVARSMVVRVRCVLGTSAYGFSNRMVVGIVVGDRCHSWFVEVLDVLCKGQPAEIGGHVVHLPKARRNASACCAAVAWAMARLTLNTL